MEKFCDLVTLTDNNTNIQFPILIICVHYTTVHRGSASMNNWW